MKRERKKCVRIEFDKYGSPHFPLIKKKCYQRHEFLKNRIFNVTENGISTMVSEPKYIEFVFIAIILKHLTEN